MIISACAFTGAVLAQPNNVGNANIFSNVYNNSNVNINVQQAVNINVQQAINVNKPKPQVTQVQTRRRTTTTISNKPSVVTAQATVRRPTRTRRAPVQSNVNPVVPAQTQTISPTIQVSNVDNVNPSNVIQVQEFNENEAPQQQLLVTNILVPVQTNKQNEVEENNVKQVSFSFPEIKMPRVYFSYADLSVSHKSISLKKSISKKMLKLSRKHKAKRGGKLRKYITNNCCKWN